MGGDLLLGEVLGVVLEDVVHRPVDPFDVVLVGQLRGSDGREQLVVLAFGELFHEDKKVSQAGHAAAVGDALQQSPAFADQRRVAELDAVARPRQQRGQAVQLGEYAAAVLQHLVGEVHQHVAPGHHLVGLNLADPVVRQVGTGEEQGVGGEVADVVADEYLAGAGDDQVQLVFLVEVPAHQRAGEAVLAVDQRMAFVIVHQLVGRIGDFAGSGHGRGPTGGTKAHPSPKRRGCAGDHPRASLPCVAPGGRRGG
ncbi:Uncharacterised protein [Acinetobacter baumannii]|nr:Uncharacterised protein [Acinetobacter baumannii]